MPSMRHVKRRKDGVDPAGARAWLRSFRVLPKMDGRNEDQARGIESALQAALCQTWKGDGDAVARPSFTIMKTRTPTSKPPREYADLLQSGTMDLTIVRRCSMVTAWVSGKPIITETVISCQVRPRSHGDAPDCRCKLRLHCACSAQLGRPEYKKKNLADLICNMPSPGASSTRAARGLASAESRDARRQSHSGERV